MAKTEFFLPLVLLARLLLLAPLFVSFKTPKKAVTLQNASKSGSKKKTTTQSTIPPSLSLLGTCGLAVIAWQSGLLYKRGCAPMELLQAVHSSPAVSALAYDAVIGIICFAFQLEEA